MNSPTTGGPDTRPSWYEIRVQGRLHPRWASWFDGMALIADNSDGTTLLRGPVVDQAALHGLLHRLRDVGLPLLSVVGVEPGRREDGRPAPRPRTHENQNPGD
ncbi:hypothetical protein ACWD4F_25850 [Streptomyces aureus]